MSYLALARKWRPRTFDQLVGQEHINKALVKSLNQQRLHHAYLFTGTRGVGKTSIARLMAKALNCEQGVSANPCLSCDACLAIEQGRFIDLIEIDAASKTRVEDTREILDNVPYAATVGRYKIYLIDEVHMLSQHSFNALLKTLEEPPSHVKFLLATTEAQKLPITILSRCLQFHLKPLTDSLIADQLKIILEDEQYAFEEEALSILAKSAKGSMRDALSLLDQAIASTNDALTTSEVKGILGFTQQDFALPLLQALAKLDALELIALSRQIAQEGGHFNYVLDELLEDLHQISLIQLLQQGPLVAEISASLIELAKLFNPEEVQLFYQIGINSIKEMQLAPTLAMGFEMMLLRMLSFKPASKAKVPPLAWETLDKVALEPSKSEEPELKESITPSTPVLTALKLKIAHDAVRAEEERKLPLEASATRLRDDALTSPQSERNLPVTPVLESWETIISQLKLSGLALSALQNAEWVEKVDSLISLRTTKGHQSLFSPQATQKIEQALSDFYKQSIKIQLLFDEPVTHSPAQKKQQALHEAHERGEVALQKDPFFQQLQEEFSAELIKNSITPIKDPL